jgi:hypothetical protein
VRQNRARGAGGGGPKQAIERIHVLRDIGITQTGQSGGLWLAGTGGHHALAAHLCGSGIAARARHLGRVLIKFAMSAYCRSRQRLGATACQLCANNTQTLINHLVGGNFCLDVEETLGVTVGDARAVGSGHWNLAEKRACLRHRCKRMIAREHDAVDPDFEH